MSAGAADSSGLRPFDAIPRMRMWSMLRQLLGSGGRRDMLSGLRLAWEEHGSAVRQPLGPFRSVFLFGPDANREVLLDADRIFSARRPWNAIMGRIFPNGLLLRDGADHVHHRRIMHTAFKRPVLRIYLERMNPMIAAALPAWQERREGFLAFPAFKALTLDMAAGIFIGADLGQETAAMNRAFERMVAASMSRIRLRLPGLEFERGLRGREFMIDYLRDRIGKRRSGDGHDLFTRLCHAETEEGDRFSDEEVIDHMIFLMMAAHDTTTSTLCSLTYELAKHPDWQERIRDESRALGRDAIDFDDLEGLPSLDWAIRETLRRYPALPVIPRVTTARFAFAGYEIPADSMVIVCPILTHHMPEWWRDPYRFDPERFAPERAEHERHTHCWVPFGAGPHHCLGFRFADLQLKAVMHQLVLRYRGSVPPDYTMPVQQAPISKPIDGLPLRLEPLV